MFSVGVQRRVREIHMIGRHSIWRHTMIGEPSALVVWKGACGFQIKAKHLPLRHVDFKGEPAYGSDAVTVGLTNEQRVVGIITAAGCNGCLRRGDIGQAFAVLIVKVGIAPRCVTVKLILHLSLSVEIVLSDSFWNIMIIDIAEVVGWMGVISKYARGCCSRIAINERDIEFFATGILTAGSYATARHDFVVNQRRVLFACILRLNKCDGDVVPCPWAEVEITWIGQNAVAVEIGIDFGSGGRSHLPTECLSGSAVKRYLFQLVKVARKTDALVLFGYTAVVEYKSETANALRHIDQHDVIVVYLFFSEYNGHIVANGLRS